MKLIAKTNIKYGSNDGETAAPGDTFELDEAKYPDSVAYLLESGDAEEAAKDEASKDETPKTGKTSKSEKGDK